jgi:2-methylcitrate dehydratase PrpD
MSSVPDATTKLASYAVDLHVDTVPPSVVRDARTILADTIGVLFAASRQTAVCTALRALPLGTGACTVIGHGRGASPESAALINGIGGHDIELDDSHSPSRTHPAAVIVPAALAAAEGQPGATLGDVISGIIAAYEVQSRVSKAIGRNEQYERGFHPSAVVGAIGAAVSAGRVLRLPLDEMRWCLALAAGQASGLLSYHDDPSHLAKSFQTGVAARNGVTAALFARAGYRAAPNVLAGRHDMLRPFGGSAVDPTELDAELGSRFYTSETSLKRHACCGLTHSAIDALLLMMSEHEIGFHEIKQLHVQLPHGSAKVVDGNTLWTHNIQYVLALAAMVGRVGLEHFSDEWTMNASIAELASRVEVESSDELQARFPEYKGAILTMSARREDHVQYCEAPRGSPDHPLTTTEIQGKFVHLAGSVLSAKRAGSLWDALIDGHPDGPVDPLFDYLSSQGTPSPELVASLEPV